MRLPTLQSDRLTLRPIEPEDVDALTEIVAEPGVSEWWGVLGDREELRSDLEHDGAAFTIEIEGQVAGWLGMSEEREPAYPSVGLDIVLAPRWQGQGLGPAALRVVIRWLIEERGHHRFTIDPALQNERAIRAYEAVGFRPVGVLRQVERAPGGSWRDGLLMDLLASELSASGPDPRSRGLGD